VVKEVTKKPATQKAQIDMLWDGVFNHLPHRLDILGIKVNMMLAFGAGGLALLGIIIALVG
jgi:hypothetical protein